MKIYVPPSLVLGCNTPCTIGVLSDFIEEQTGQPLDLDQSGWSEANDNYDEDSYYLNVYVCNYGDGIGYGDTYVDGNGYGEGCGFITGDGYEYGDCEGDGYGYGDGNRWKEII